MKLAEKLLAMHEKSEQSPSTRPPKEWWKEREDEIKKKNPEYSSDQIDNIIGAIWYHNLDDAKRLEIRQRYGRTYGEAPKNEAHKSNVSDTIRDIKGNIKQLVEHVNTLKPKSVRLEDFMESINNLEKMLKDKDVNEDAVLEAKDKMTDVKKITLQDIRDSKSEQDIKDALKYFAHVFDKLTVGETSAFKNTINSTAKKIGIEMSTLNKWMQNLLEKNPNPFNEAKDEVHSILVALNSTSGAGGDKYPFGNKELTAKVKALEAGGKIYYDDKFNKWHKGKK